MNYKDWDFVNCWLVVKMLFEMEYEQVFYVEFQGDDYYCINLLGV